MPTVEGFRQLDVWRKAMDFAKAIYHCTESCPPHEAWTLRAPMRRAAVSISSSIAERSARFSTKEFSRFVSIARGSSAEAISQAILASEVGFLSCEQLADLEARQEEISRMLVKLKAALDAATRRG